MSTTATYSVKGMTCGGCAGSVNRAVSAAAPGAAVEVDLEAASVRVDGEHDPERIKDAIEGAGFDFEGAQA